MYNEMIKIAEHYGLSAQLDQTVEECAELIQAINKYKRKIELSTKENLFEEIADVEIMLEQIKHLLMWDGYNYTDVVTRLHDIKDVKISRQLERIEGEVNAMAAENEEV